MKYLNVLICYSKYKEENENVFFIVTNKGTFFFPFTPFKNTVTINSTTYI